MISRIASGLVDIWTCLTNRKKRNLTITTFHWRPRKVQLSVFENCYVNLSCWKKWCAALKRLDKGKLGEGGIIKYISIIPRVVKFSRRQHRRWWYDWKKRNDLWKEIEKLNKFNSSVSCSWINFMFIVTFHFLIILNALIGNRKCQSLSLLLEIGGWLIENAFYSFG